MNLIKLITFQLLFVTFYLHANESQTIQTVNQLITESHTAKAEKVWPGFDLTASPVMITFSNGHIYAFNLKSSDSRWQKLKLAGKTVLFSEQDHWGVSKSAMNPKFPIEGQNAYVFNLDKADDNQKLFEILVHERFHRYQFEHFPMKKMGGRYIDEINVENLAYMQMEEMALANFFKAAGDPILQKEYLVDFSAINQTRRALLKNLSIQWEDHQQVMEGLADYVSFKIFDVLHVFDRYDGNSKLKELLEMYAQNPNITERAVKWRHYGVGAAMGYGLDFLQVKEWKQQIEQGASMASLLNQALSLTPEEIQERMATIEMSYGYNFIKESLGRTVADYEKFLDNLEKAYGKSEGVVIEIGRPLNSSISGGGMTARTIYLANGTTISMQDTSMMTNVENTWKLELKDVPFVYQSRIGHREFKIDHNSEFNVDGKSYNLRDLIKKNIILPFRKLFLKSKACQFTSDKESGNLCIENGKVYITYIR